MIVIMNIVICKFWLLYVFIIKLEVDYVYDMFGNKYFDKDVLYICYIYK